MLFTLSDTRSTWMVYTAFLAVVALLFFADLADLPIDTHDEDYFLDSADTLAAPAAFFAPDKRMPGRPALELVFLLQYMAWGTSGTAYHLCGGLFHLIAALALARAGRALGLDLELALLTGLLFLINVGHFNAIHWISAQCYALVLICGSIALCAYVRDRPLPVYALLLIGVLFHISAAAFLPFFLYLSWQRGDRPIFRRYLPLALLLATVVLSLKIGYPQAPQASIVADGFDPWGLLRNQLVCWSRLISTAHWLVQPLHRFPVWEWILGATGLGIFAVLQWRRHFTLSPWLAWVFVHLLPIAVLSPAYIQTVPSGPSRYLYLASAGSAGILAWLLRHLAARSPLRPRLVFALLLLLLSYSSYTGLSKATAIAYYASGRHFLASHQLDEGIVQLKRAIATAPETINLEDAYVRLVFADIYNTEAVKPTLTQAQALFPDNALFTIAPLVLACMAPDLLQESEPLRLLHKFKAQGTGNADWTRQLFENVGDGFYDREAWDQAVQAYRYALEFDLTRIPTRVQLGWVLVMTNRFTEAIEEYETVLQNGPHSEAHFNIALAHMLRGDNKAARSTYAAGIQKYGRATAEELGVPQRLQRLIGLDIRAAEARDIIRSFWPERVEPQ